jgi:hypothetical protein
MSSLIQFSIVFHNVADPECLSRNPDSNFFHPDPGSASKNLSILTQKIVSKLFPDPDPDFLTSWIPDPGGKKAPDSGSGTLVLLFHKRCVIASDHLSSSPGTVLYKNAFTLVNNLEQIFSTVDMVPVRQCKKL